MDIRKLQRAIVDGLEDVKAQDIRVFNTEHLSPLFERVIVASGTSNRQTKALASSVRETVKARGLAVLRTEGEDNGEWIIVDCGAAVAHIMQPAIRQYYNLEEIWGEKAVRLRSSVEAKPAPAAKAVARKAASAKVPAKVSPKASSKATLPKSPAHKSARQAAATPARKSTAGKTAAGHATARTPRTKA
ncbi:MAG TPA: ribosome silencing factor [Burkholderiaceae bacterium]|nr:ribosome silencing factor [Burkholderiaceae bacterium]